jgi:hypothetical protein
MDQSVVVLIGAAIAAVAGLAAFSAYRWVQRRRVRMVKQWVTSYLFTRFGEPLDEVSVACTDDRRWPVLANFDDPRTKIRHRLQFQCSGSGPAFELLSETQESR